MKPTSWPLVVFGFLGSVFLFLFSPTGCRGLVIPRGLGTLSMPRFPGDVGGFLLLTLDVRLGLKEEGIERGWCLNAHNFGKVTAGTEPALEEIFFHVASR